ncbi:methyltransferase [Rhizobium sp. G21]|uniref:methyltransferase n=1 Tax=Rhizobium sp. G21 TaxID=2758439 RepID=UPI0015FF3CD8|nr:methyltransferase [Rhizobium sp. G21]MBB1251232.1 methyltransferase [Rhizobium sp. G21]
MATPSEIRIEPAHAAVAPSLAVRFRLWRNRLVGSTDFRRLIARVPVLRALGNRKANALFRLTGGFISSQLLLAGVRLGLYELLRDKVLSAGEIAHRLNVPPSRMRTLLKANADLGLLIEIEPDLWALDDAGTVIASDPGVAAMIRHHDMLYRDLLEPEQLFREGAGNTELGRYWAYARGGDPGALPPAAVADYSTLMRHSQSMMTDCLLPAYDFGRYSMLVDVGGGDGAFLTAVGRRHRNLKLGLLDLPAVAERARIHLAAEGFAARSQIFCGDFCRDPAPADADCVTLIRILCDHDDDRVRVLLANLYRSLRPGARILVAEAMSGPSAGARLASAYFSVYFLAMGSGRCRSADEISDLLTEAGFQAAKTVSTSNPLIATIVCAQR